MRPLAPPPRPLDAATSTRAWLWRWRSPTAGRPWLWCRVYHRDDHAPTGSSARVFGPLARFDHHAPPAPGPALDPGGRSVLYVGGDLVTSAAEVFGEVGEAVLCPRWRVAVLRPLRPLRLLDLVAPGAAMGIGALPTLADGHHPRALTQEWARAVYEDDPLGVHLDGIRYRTAYDGGTALALWDSERLIETVTSSSGEVQDLALSDPRVLSRTTAGLNRRRVVVRTCGPEECPRCPRS